MHATIFAVVAALMAQPADSLPWRVHEVDSPYQPGRSVIRVLLPKQYEGRRRYRVVYVLPVEPREESRYGDGLREIVDRDLHNKYPAIFVAPSFAQLPWYADHPSDPAIRQESHLMKIVLPLVERNYSTIAGRDGRLLLGFSKSGWGAWSLLLRRPNSFARAVAWDAPLMMDRAGQYGSLPIFGTQENFAGYRLTDLLSTAAPQLRGQPRLLLAGYGNFRSEHEQMHQRLKELKIPHTYRDGPPRKHDWHSGWVAEAVEMLLEMNSGGADAAK